MQFCCTLPTCKRSFATEMGLYQHKFRDPIHNRNKNYNSYNKVGNKRDFLIPYEGISRNPESNLSNKTLTGPKYIDADIMAV